MHHENIYIYLHIFILITLETLTLFYLLLLGAFVQNTLAVIVEDSLVKSLQLLQFEQKCDSLNIK